jgi:hypothetical protein
MCIGRSKLAIDLKEDPWIRKRVSGGLWAPIALFTFLCLLIRAFTWENSIRLTHPTSPESVQVK